MKISRVIQHAITNIMSLGATAFLTSHFEKIKPKQSGENTVLVMPKLYAILSIFLFLFFTLTGYITLCEESILLLKIIYGLFALFLLYGSINTLLLYKNHQVIYNLEGINHTSWQGKTTTIQWEEIKMISFSPLASSLKIETEKETIFIHEHIIGYKPFLKFVERKTGLKMK